MFPYMRLPMVGMLAALLSGSPAFAGDVFLSPRLEALAGYEKNRMEDPGSGEGAPFWQASPGLEVTAFGEKTETSLYLDYRRTQYTKSDFESRDEASAFGRWRYFRGRNGGGLSVGGGLYRDEALPVDDFTFWQARPHLVHTFEDWPAEWSLSGTFRQTFYDVDVSTSVTDRADRRIDVRPGFRWHVSYRTTVWAELYAEHNASNDMEEEYSGFGGAIGCELRPTARTDVGVWAGTGARAYAQKAGGEKRRDAPTPAGAWASYRLRPWIDLSSAVEWASYASTIDAHDHDWWRVSLGFKVVLEHAVGAR